MTDTLWTLPVAGPQRRVGHRPLGPGLTDRRPGRVSDWAHHVRVARAAEAAGFSGLLVPDRPDGDEPWITATALAREAPRLQLVPELHPGSATAVYTAKLALSFQRFFADRLGWKIALDGDPAERRALGDVVVGEERVERADELLEVVAGVWAGSPFTHEGRWATVVDGGFYGGAQTAGGQGIARRPSPTTYLDGTGPAALDLSARRGDVHLFDLDAPGTVAHLIDDLRRRASDVGRHLRVGLRVPILARHRGGEAWRDLERAIERAGREHDARPTDDGLRWDGFDDLGLTRRSGLVGSFDDVAASLVDWTERGIDVLVLEGLDPVGDAYRWGEHGLHQVVAPAEPVPSDLAGASA